MILNRKKIQEPQIFRLKTDLYMYISLVVKEGENSYYTCIVGSKIRTQQISIHYHFIYSNLSKTRACTLREYHVSSTCTAYCSTWLGILKNVYHCLL